MSFPRYHKYKDSGVEWLGQVPAHWEVKRIGYYFNERREKVSDKDFPALSVTKNGIVPQLDTVTSFGTDAGILIQRNWGSEILRLQVKLMPSVIRRLS